MIPIESKLETLLPLSVFWSPRLILSISKLPQESSLWLLSPFLVEWSWCLVWVAGANVSISGACLVLLPWTEKVLTSGDPFRQRFSSIQAAILLLLDSLSELNSVLCSRSFVSHKSFSDNVDNTVVSLTGRRKLRWTTRLFFVVGSSILYSRCAMWVFPSYYMDHRIPHVGQLTFSSFLFVYQKDLVSHVQSQRIS